ncbi:uracil phosphoribosyltransferase [Chitinivorax tropicus]|uniref:Uracil phosphoribosyltransferase n=1 Tax=Chitinivorax tropicus TaxID=714531 RepID=A0A840MEP0_9PROT|nr:uracil phosphoribosyltransferase [Chitinivorax tropicus]MBB5017148.1 uracil phosphoribosyltransferase [Chitinivorax tropicus]
MNITEIRHPLVRHKVGLMREVGITPAAFRALVAEVSRLIAVEATRDIELDTAQIECWSGRLSVPRLPALAPTLVPILRAGLGMLEGVQAMLPESPVSMIGIKRDEHTLQPHAYYLNLASHIDERIALILDPMLATGGSLCATIDALKKAGCKRMCALTLVSAPEGVRHVNTLHPDVPLYTAAVDERLNEHGYILPGLGDAGDKIFGTDTHD